jgi:hypothetical protein
VIVPRSRRPPAEPAYITPATQALTENRLHPVVHPVLHEMLGIVPPEPARTVLDVIDAWTDRPASRLTRGSGAVPRGGFRGTTCAGPGPEPSHHERAAASRARLRMYQQQIRTTQSRWHMIWQAAFGAGTMVGLVEPQVMHEREE